jgi:hypothetical protein
VSSPFDPTLPPQPDSRPSVGELFSDVSVDLSTLIRQEVELAKAELRQSATRAGKGAGMLAGAGISGYMVLLFASFAAWWGIGDATGHGWSALIVAAIWLIVAAILGLMGRREISAVSGVPQTAQTVKKIKRKRGHIMTSDPDQIREQIEETRISLSEDVNTLADTVNPAHAAKRRAAGARSAVLRVKDKVMGAASQSVSSTTSAAGEKASAVHEKASAAPDRLRRQAAGNPLAVGLIAVGVGWLVGSLLPATSAEERAATKVKETAAPAVTGAAKDAAAGLQDSAKQAAESVKAAAADAAAAVKDETASSAHDVRDQARAARDTVTDSRH